MSSTERPFRWRSVTFVALLPTVLFSIGEGAIIPVLPVVAGDVGATLAVAGLVGAALLFGELLGDIPTTLDELKQKIIDGEIKVPTKPA